MFKTGYETFVNHPDELKVGQEFELEVRDCDKYRTRVVKALVFPPGEGPTEGESLWVRGTIGYLISEEPWRIKISEVIEEL